MLLASARTSHKLPPSTPAPGYFRDVLNTLTLNKSGRPGIGVSLGELNQSGGFAIAAVCAVGSRRCGGAKQHAAGRSGGEEAARGFDGAR